MYRISLKSILVCAALAALPAAFANAPATDPWLRPSAAPAPQDNAPSASRVDLGRSLFFDPRLSGSNWISCATCHNPTLGWTDALPTAIGNGQKSLPRKTPTILNTAFNSIQMWDGRKRSLEDQALGPITSPGEMDLSADDLVSKLRSIAGYRSMFDSAYPGEGITTETVAKAIASYERTILSTDSPFDRWRRGDAHAVSEAAKRGFTLFDGKARCSLCHQGFNFTDNGFHNIGLRDAGAEPDNGRFAHVKIKVLKGAFKTPTLRDIAITGPYMHNGSYRTLEEVVEHYDRGGDARDNISPNIQPLNLTAQEKGDLVEFMKSLTGEPMLVTLPSLPR